MMFLSKGQTMCWLLLQLFISDLYGQTILVRPRNAAAVESSNVRLQCGFTTNTTQLIVKWTEFITVQTTGAVISVNGTKNPNYQDQARAKRHNIIRVSEGQYDLQISPFTVNDTGYYSCTGNNFDRPKYGAYFIFLTPGTCNAFQGGNVVDTVVEGEEFTLGCQRGYRSFPGWPPILEWSGPTPISITRNITTTTDTRYEVDLRAHESMDGNTYRCRTLFTSPPLFKSPDDGFEDDTSTPTINEADCEVKIQVHWPAKYVVRLPENNVYYPGDSVICSAFANPRPIYRWCLLSGNGPQESSSATLLITEDMIGDSVYECIVTNKVHNKDTNSSRIFTFKVQPRYNA